MVLFYIDWLIKSLLSSRRRKRRGRGPAHLATACGCNDTVGGNGRTAQRPPFSPPTSAREIIVEQARVRPSPDSPSLAASRSFLFAGIRTRPPGVPSAPDSHQSAASRLRSRGYAPTFGHEPSSSTTTPARHPAALPAPDNNLFSASRALLLARVRASLRVTASGKTAFGQTAFGHEPVWAQK